MNEVARFVRRTAFACSVLLGAGLSAPGCAEFDTAPVPGAAAPNSVQMQ